MHLHLPKAIHGWREFAKEVGIIVLGVLIALGFEQVVQMWHWRHDARETREALTSELEYSALWADERIAVQKCLRDRITQLTAKLHGSGTHWDADPVVLGNPRRPVGRSLQTSLPLAYRAPHRPWLSDEWQTAKSSGIIDHMARSDAHNLEFVYRNVIQLDSLQTEETSLSPQLSFLSFAGTLDPQSRIQALNTLARLDYLNAMQVQSSEQMLSTLRSTHLALRPISFGQHLTSFSRARDQVMSALKERYGSCVGPPPPE
jgi:hypothetical protein